MLTATPSGTTSSTLLPPSRGTPSPRQRGSESPLPSTSPPIQLPQCLLLAPRATLTQRSRLRLRKQVGLHGGPDCQPRRHQVQPRSASVLHQEGREGEDLRAQQGRSKRITQMSPENGTIVKGIQKNPGVGTYDAKGETASNIKYTMRSRTLDVFRTPLLTQTSTTAPEPLPAPQPTATATSSR